MRTFFSIALLAGVAIPAVAAAAAQDAEISADRSAAEPRLTNDRAAARPREARVEQRRSFDAVRTDQPRPAAEAAQVQRSERGSGRDRFRDDGRPDRQRPDFNRDRTPQPDRGPGFDNRGPGFDRNQDGRDRTPGAGNGRDDRNRFDPNRPGRGDGTFERSDNDRDGYGRNDLNRFGNRTGYDRGGYNGNDRTWNRGWRNDNRYDWQRYRSANRNVFRLPRYYAPYGWNTGYRRFAIGAYLFGGLYARDYWIGQPYDYRLPPAYYPYQWVRYYGDALLVDTRSGYVVDVIPGIFY